MLRVLRSEWVKLRRKGLLAGAYLGLAGAATLVTTLVFNRAGRRGPRGGESVITLARLAQADGLVFAVRRAAPLLGVVTLSVAAAQVALEYSQGTLRSVLVREPRRLRLLAGKYVAVLTFTVGAVLVAAIASGATAFGMAHTRSISTSAWTSSTGLHDNAQALGDALLAIVGYTTLGVALGTVMRSPVAAVVIGLAYLLAFDNILAAIVTDAARWLPGQLLDALARGGNDTASFASAAWTLAAYLTVAGAVAALLFARRDVTV